MNPFIILEIESQKEFLVLNYDGIHYLVEDIVTHMLSEVYQSDLCKRFKFSRWYIESCGS